MSPETKIVLSKAIERRYCEREGCGMPLGETNPYKECRRHIDAEMAAVVPLARKERAIPAVGMIAQEVKENLVSAHYVPPATKKEALVRAVCQYYGVPRGRLCGFPRDKETVRARQMLMYLLCVECTHLSKAQLAGFLERDITTILHGYRKVLENLPKRQNEVNAVLAIYEKIKPASE